MKVAVPEMHSKELRKSFRASKFQENNKKLWKDKKTSGFQE
jgi:hypothetical protein